MAGLTLDIPVCEHLRDWRGQPIVARQPWRCGRCGWSAQADARPETCPQCGADQVEGGDELPADQQPTVGRMLLRLLETIRPEKPAQSILAVRAGTKIADALDEGEAYQARERDLGVLRAAWRQATKEPDRSGLGALVLGQIGEILGVEVEADADAETD